MSNPSQHTQTLSSDALKADGLLLLVTLLAASGWIFSKEALVGLPPLLFIGIRFLIAGAVLAASGFHTILRLDWYQWRCCTVAGCLFGIAMSTWIQGLHIGKHMGEGAFITSLGVVLVPVIGRLLFGERPPVGTWIALPVAISGLALLSLRQGFAMEPGQIYFVLAAGLFAIHFNLVSRLVARVPALALTGTTLLIAGGMTFLGSWYQETWPTQISLPIWGWVLASAVLASSLRFFLQAHAQGLTPASHAAMIMTIEPVWTALLAMWWFGESMEAVQLAGCCLIFSALLISRLSWLSQLLKRVRR
jgi:drug/metabolite transporter (DMT)-like permease